MGELTVYPDANPESTSVDGNVVMTSVGSAWSTIRDGSGTSATDEDVSLPLTWGCGTSSNTYSYLSRGVFLFDTSDILEGYTITSAVLHINYTNSVSSGYSFFDISGYAIHLVASSPGSNTELVAGDYDSLGTTDLSDTTMGLGGLIMAGFPRVWDLPLNADGLASITKEGVTKLGLRFSFDIGDTAPVWISDAYYEFYFDSAEVESGYPQLVITYTGDSKYFMTAQSDETTAPRSWRIYGSNDQAAWTLIDTQTDITFSADEEKEFAVDSDAYTYYRLYVDEINGASSWELHDLNYQI